MQREIKKQLLTIKDISIMSTMISFANHNLSEQFMTEEDIFRVCPKAFCDAPTNPKVSKHYVQANTMTVVRDLAQLGWFPVMAKQCRGKKNSSGIHSFHMIAFQNPNVKIMRTDGSQEVDIYPRIILSNSHDGFNSFKFMVGLYRTICSNGLVVCDEQFAQIAIRHMNYDFEELRVVVAKAISDIPNIVYEINAMRNITPSEEQRIALATEVVRIRKGIAQEEDLELSEEVVEDILTPLRSEDKANDLWTLFNVCQEKMIKGGFYCQNSGTKVRKQKSITSIKKDLDYNQRLWQIARQYLLAA